MGFQVEIFLMSNVGGKAMVAYTKPQQRKKEEIEWPRGERDQIKFIDLRFERWQVVRFRKARRMGSKYYRISSWFINQSIAFPYHRRKSCKNSECYSDMKKHRG